MIETLIGQRTKKRRVLTDGTQRRFLELRQAAIVNGQMADVEAEEHIRLQLRQIVVPKPQIKDHRVRPPFQLAHHLRDVKYVRVLAYDVQAGFLQCAGTGRDFTVRGAVDRLREAQTRCQTHCPNQCP